MKIIFLFVFGVCGSILLQVFLSKRENRWLGLILPIIAFLTSFIYLLNMMAGDNITQTIITAVSAFLLCNIPTAVYLVIYFACREKFKRKRDLDKMSAQDLE